MGLAVLNCDSWKEMYCPPLMKVLSGMRNLSRFSAELVRYQPPTSMGEAVVLCSSIQSVPAPPLVEISLITMASTAVAFSAMPWGDPKTNLLGRQLAGLSQVEGSALGSMITSVWPAPSVVGCQESL